MKSIDLGSWIGIIHAAVDNLSAQVDTIVERVSALEKKPKT
jgi:hypothetical protein